MYNQFKSEKASKSEAAQMPTATGPGSSPVIVGVLGSLRHAPEIFTCAQAAVHAPLPTPLPIVAASSTEVGLPNRKPLREVLSEAGHKALGGGIPGMAAMATQVLTLMWLRTTVNYQYRYGTNTMTALRTLYKEGGVPRFYRGIVPALVQAPLSRFGDTAANAGTLALLESYGPTRGLPLGLKTAVASTAAGGFRILLMPVDTCKTIMQVEGKEALAALAHKVRASGPGVLYHGALAAWAATFIGHYPWFATYNYMNAVLPRAPSDDLPHKLGRSAFIGFCSSFVSDVVSNSARVIKTTKQTSKEATTYPRVARTIIEKDGVLGLLGRGLKTKIIANGLQGICFTILWRLGQDWWEAHNLAVSPKPPRTQSETSSTSTSPASGNGGGAEKFHLAAATPAEEPTTAAIATVATASPK